MAHSLELRGLGSGKDPYPRTRSGSTGQYFHEAKGHRCLEYGKRSASSIRIGATPVHGPDVRIERSCHSKRLSSALSSHQSSH